MNSVLKKIIVGGAIILSAASLCFGDEQGKNEINNRINLVRPTEKLEKISIEKNLPYQKRDPFLPPSKYRLAPREARMAVSLEELSKRLVKSGFEKEMILRLYSDNRFKIHLENINYFKNNPEIKTRTYEQYKKKLGLEEKIKHGPGFFKNNIEALLGAEKEFGVEASVISAIIGVETDYGRNLGRYRAVNAAVSLYVSSISSNKREFAYNQIKSLLNYCLKKGIDPFDIYSSYAICVGYGQFLPENLDKFFIGKSKDFDADLKNLEDWIYSIAYYLKKAGWNAKQNYKNFEEGNTNWKAVWNYNHSNYYVRAVFELAKAIRESPDVKGLIKEKKLYKKGVVQR